jgi:hypothetical protein
LKEKKNKFPIKEPKVNPLNRNAIMYKQTPITNAHCDHRKSYWKKKTNHNRNNNSLCNLLYSVSDHTLALFAFRNYSLLLPLLLPLADLNELTGISQPTLGVLFFPLSPPSCKGATHNQKSLAPQLASRAELPLTMS